MVRIRNAFWSFLMLLDDLEGVLSKQRHHFLESLHIELAIPNLGFKDILLYCAIEPSPLGGSHKCH